MMEFLTDLSHWLAREETRFWLSWCGLALVLTVSVSLAIAQLKHELAAAEAG